MKDIIQGEYPSKTIVINLFGGPSVSKSTHAAGLFYELKLEGINCELVREYAKDRVWLGDVSTLKHQSYITCKQYFRQCSVDGQVDVIVTDSPVLLGLVYPGRGLTPGFRQWMLEVFNEFNNVNIYLTRSLKEHAYNPSGRTQKTPEEAIGKDVEIKNLLDNNNIPYITVPVEKRTTLKTLYDITIKALENVEKEH